MRRAQWLAATLSAIVLAVLIAVLPARGDGDIGSPIDGLSDEELARFEAGRATFSEPFSAAHGLGPVFNGRACAECHADPAPGGSNFTTAHQVVLFGRQDFNGGFDPMIQLGGPFRSQRSIKEELPGCNLSGEKVPKEANVMSHRQPPALYGLGLIAAIPDEVIVAQAGLGAQADPGEVYGRPSMVNGRVARFGWKAQAATLDAFIAQAMVDELGITTPLEPAERLPQGQPIPGGCDLLPDPEDDGSRLAALVDFVTLLAPPQRGPVSDAAAYGEQVFRDVGCTTCHVPSLRTGPSPIAALSERDVPLYSDLLLHDLGTYVVDETVQGQAGNLDWRTTPLWGLGRKKLYLHDGRTDDLLEVIKQHSGEARETRYRLLKRPKGDIAALIEFLKSL